MRREEPTRRAARFLVRIRKREPKLEEVMRLIYAVAIAAVISGPAMAQCNPGAALNAERNSAIASTQAN
jgi:hypothetical protein